jgi:hypothetical protein
MMSFLKNSLSYFTAKLLWILFNLLGLAIPSILIRLGIAIEWSFYFYCMYLLILSCMPQFNQYPALFMFPLLIVPAYTTIILIIKITVFNPNYLKALFHTPIVPWIIYIFLFFFFTYLCVLIRKYVINILTKS